MAIIEEYDQSTQLQPQPQPRYTGPAKPILLSSRKAAPPPTASNPAGNLSVADPLGSVHLLLFDRQYWHILAGLLLLGECVMCALIIRFVSYTEIDWSTYMQQVRSFIAGERDYSQIYGDTGPLVYPAGFLWAYSALYYLTDRGRNILAAQVIFAGIYLATQALVFTIYSRCRSVPPYALILLTLSKRLHSIYVLRMFNDGVGMVFFYGAVVAWTASRPRWNLGCVLFSLALSIKMNFLLYLPALLYLLWTSLGPLPSLPALSLLLLPQLALATPFLHSPASALTYLRTAFNLDRAFLWEWTVNWRWLGEEAFHQKELAGALMVGHVVGLGLVGLSWGEAEGGLLSVIWRGVRSPARAAGRGRPSADRICTILFTSNVVGIVFARSLHYQFYAWYAHQVVFLLWQAPFELPHRAGLLAAIEWGWNVFPSTERSSLTVTVTNFALVVAALTGGDGGGFVAVPAGEKQRAVGEGEKEKVE